MLLKFIIEVNVPEGVSRAAVRRDLRSSINRGPSDKFVEGLNLWSLKPAEEYFIRLTPKKKQHLSRLTRNAQGRFSGKRRRRKRARGV